MAFGSGFWYQQRKDQRNRFAVGCFKLHRSRQSQKAANSILDTLDAAVWNSDALAEPGRTEFFPGKQCIVHGTSGNPVPIFKQYPGLLENALLAARIEVEKNVFRWQEFW